MRCVGRLGTVTRRRSPAHPAASTDGRRNTLGFVASRVT